jgi:hypothetical protein
MLSLARGTWRLGARSSYIYGEKNEANMLLKTKEKGRFWGKNEPKELNPFLSKRIGSKSALICVQICAHGENKTKRRKLAAGLAAG